MKKLIEEGKTKNDDRYFLIASLGASNAVFQADNNIKKEIDTKIKAMIPPKNNEIYELAQAGIYLLPFLKDCEGFSNKEKERCLRLLSSLDTEEAIPDILSYISGNGNDNVKIYALDMLSVYEEEKLDEYNVREQLINITIKSVNKESLITYEIMLNMISKEELPAQDKDFFME